MEPLLIPEAQLRREAVLAQLPADAAMLVPAAQLQTRSRDVSFPFCQNKDFWYLTGLNQPQAVLLLLPNRSQGSYILFCPKEDPEHAIWEGPQVGPRLARDLYHADQAFPLEELPSRLAEMLSDRKALFYDLGGRLDALVLKAIEEVKRKVRKGVQAPTEIHACSSMMAECRLFKSDFEIQMIEKACHISVDAHARAMRACHAGMYEYQLEAELLHEFMQQGTRSVAYPSIVGAGHNACILHYIDNAAQLQADQLVLIDAGCEWQGYASDITRTFPVSGKFSEAQAQLYQVVLNAQTRVIEQVAIGVEWDALQQTAIRELTQGMVDLGILSGSVEALIESKAYRQFYMHNIGHWLGLDVHDVGQYKLNKQWRTLQTGMVFTVEPGLYIPVDASVPEQWRGMGIRIEDDVLVTSAGPRVLTEALPKTIAGIEQLMQTKDAVV